MMPSRTERERKIRGKIKTVSSTCVRIGRNQGQGSKMKPKKQIRLDGSSQISWKSDADNSQMITGNSTGTKTTRE